jgi:hypothetical protein
LLTHLKQFKGGKRMGSDEEVKQTVEDRCSGLAADLYDAGVQELVTRCDKWLIFMEIMQTNYLTSVVM